MTLLQQILFLLRHWLEQSFIHPFLSIYLSNYLSIYLLSMKTKNKNRIRIISHKNNRDRRISWKNSIIWLIKNIFWMFLTMLNSYCCCSVAKSYPTLCGPMDCSTPGFPVLHYLLEFAQTHVHFVSDAI